MQRSRDLICKTERCPAYNPAPSMTADEVMHCDCGGVLELAVFPLATVWVGAITSKYLDKSKEGGHKKDGAHFAWENGAKHGIGAKPTYIETWQQQREYCKRNGLAVPSEMGSNHEVAADGKKVLNPIGMPGCEV